MYFKITCFFNWREYIHPNFVLARNMFRLHKNSYLGMRKTNFAFRAHDVQQRSEAFTRQSFRNRLLGARTPLSHLIPADNCPHAGAAVQQSNGRAAAGICDGARQSRGHSPPLPGTGARRGLPPPPRAPSSPLGFRRLSASPSAPLELPLPSRVRPSFIRFPPLLHAPARAPAAFASSHVLWASAASPSAAHHQACVASACAEPSSGFRRIREHQAPFGFRPFVRRAPSGCHHQRCSHPPATCSRRPLCTAAPTAANPHISLCFFSIFVD